MASACCFRVGPTLIGSVRFFFFVGGRTYSTDLFYDRSEPHTSYFYRTIHAQTNMTSRVLRSKNKNTNKRQRLNGDGASADAEDASAPSCKRQLKLCAGLQAYMGGRKYCLDNELTQEMLLEYVMAKGDIKVVDTFDVKVVPMNGNGFDVTLDEEENKVLMISHIHIRCKCP
jgi:hypothetical protein